MNTHYQDSVFNILQSLHQSIVNKDCFTFRLLVSEFDNSLYENDDYNKLLDSYSSSFPAVPTMTTIPTSCCLELVKIELNYKQATDNNNK